MASVSASIARVAVGLVETRGPQRVAKCHKEIRREPLFSLVEWIIFAAAVVSGVLGIFGLATGYITI
ncbi:hypothetical protein [Mesorhizobium tamadayense]|uniref:hypothetical protein n=1 Tax=Mesorhizobium tamadayense TaxID=425306 RepID=UPI00142D4774|nr:hypothetical protein [Mesorhizobium tamadayense]